MKLQFHLMNWYGQTISKKVCDRAVFLEKIWYLILWSRFLITTKDMYIHHKTCYRDESQKKLTIKLSVENIDTPPIRNRPERHDNLPTKSTFNMDTTRNRSCVDWRYSIVMGTWSGWQQRWHNCWSLLSWWCVMESASGLHHALPNSVSWKWSPFKFLCFANFSLFIGVPALKHTTCFTY
jgi:hypothetical protein